MSTTSLKIGTGEDHLTFALPVDFVTQTAAILARKRVGKTYTASVIAEEFLEARIPFVVLDPTGAWWGLRSHYPVVIIGGAHGDVPLEPTAGAVIADLVTEHPGFYVVDLSQTKSDAEQDRFAEEFATRLYRAKERHRFPLHLFVDEADSFAPQRPFPRQTKMLGAFEAIVRRGGIRGLGMAMITQRPAVLNKNVLTQSEVLIVLQMTAPQDQDAIEDWVRRNGTKEQRDTMMTSLASLQRGEAWVWSPSWLQCFEKIQVRERRSFNSSATPKPGETMHAPRAMERVDLEKLGAQIAATVERAKENDPAALKARIVKLEVDLAKRQAAPVPEKVTIMQPVFAPEDRAALKWASEQLDQVKARIDQLAQDIQKRLQLVSVSERTVPRPPVVASQTTKTPTKIVWTDDGSLNKPERAILSAIVQFPNSSRDKVGIVAGYSPSSGHFDNTLGALRTKGFVERSLPLRATSEGVAALGEFTPLPTGRQLCEYWMRKLGKPERAILQALVDAYPNALSREELGARSGYSHTSGHFDNTLGRLRTLELASRGAQIRASEHLFG